MSDRNVNAVFWIAAIIFVMWMLHSVAAPTSGAPSCVTTEVTECE